MDAVGQKIRRWKNNPVLNPRVILVLITHMSNFGQVRSATLILFSVLALIFEVVKGL